LPGKNSATRFKKSRHVRHFVKFATISLAWTKCATTSRPAPWYTRFVLNRILCSRMNIMTWHSKL
jgi:hypothetical protein